MKHRLGMGRLWAASAIAGVLAGCGTAAPAGTIEQPSFDGGDGADTAIVAGTLAGDPERDGGCAWLELPDGQLAAIAWAFPVFLRTDDMVLVDEHGEVLAEVGDRIQLGGGGSVGWSPHYRQLASRPMMESEEPDTVV